ncbi:Membrane-anchored ribosome-binding protein, inhibits growth in stationary phase, ElaB/YqjD/DUF883 family [Pseudooceanicola antarcticus]|uniref:DUF883 domain-containing protein n=1 Tax=Pseudooceanicola antarcticus TaxID=1247613 RepID=A0A285JIJ2_9RHOB|nr:DUF883 C-terminal domain-containing protein [Pseudooceanicola antarcticus]PJE26452.1 DUF883 domain-containing protein [Pseudooceanicola antarcticus]SNY59617.1 Membrane-anchored ribosome-binding protein, inhibits growth in stationary phase, ElaB/YqjD/DUF883 family [Pseudooceanicola antarcticus]
MATTKAAETARNSKPAPQGDTAEIQAQLEAVRADVAELTRALASYGKAQKDGMTEAARARAEALKGDAEAGLAEAEARAREAYQRTETAVRDNPGTAMALAGGVGFLAGLFMARR